MFLFGQKFCIHTVCLMEPENVATDAKRFPLLCNLRASVIGTGHRDVCVVAKLKQMQADLRAGAPVLRHDGAPLQGIDDPALLDIEWGMDFGSPHETALTQLYAKPVFVVGFPTAVKAFYMEPYPGRPEACKSADLLAPEGYGEIIGGSERISDHDVLLQRIRDHELPEENYRWYLDLRRFGSVPHSGFGLGVERTVSWICGLEHIREASPFPRMLNRMYP